MWFALKKVLNTMLKKSGLSTLGTPGINDLHQLLFQSIAKRGEPVITSWRSPVSNSKLQLSVINHTKGGGQQWRLYSETSGTRELMFDCCGRDVLVVHGLICSTILQLQQLGRRNDLSYVKLKIG